jgi:septation ring formation regulator EzrA|tara:strand:+ start:516 stop:695 length:180 start_codon:yes stop_codon:yes gene_type:complete
MRYQRVVEERLGQIKDSLERVKENVDDNAIAPEQLSNRLSKIIEMLTTVENLVELEDED